MLSSDQIQDYRDALTDIEVYAAEVARNGGTAALTEVEAIRFKQYLADAREIELIFEENGYDREGYPYD